MATVSYPKEMRDKAKAEGRTLVTIDIDDRHVERKAGQMKGGIGRVTAQFFASTAEVMRLMNLIEDRARK